MSVLLIDSVPRVLGNPLLVSLSSLKIKYIFVFLTKLNTIETCPFYALMLQYVTLIEICNSPYNALRVPQILVQIVAREYARDTLFYRICKCKWTIFIYCPGM